MVLGLLAAEDNFAMSVNNIYIGNLCLNPGSVSGLCSNTDGFTISVRANNILSVRVRGLFSNRHAKSQDNVMMQNIMRISNRLFDKTLLLKRRFHNNKQFTAWRK